MDTNLIQTDPEDQKRHSLQTAEMTEIQQFADELMHSSFDELTQKYTLKELSDAISTPRAISGTNVIDYITLLRQLFVIDFCPSERVSNLSGQVKEKIIYSIAILKPTDSPQIAQDALKQISSDLILPSNFTIIDYQPRALELYNASYNIKNIMSEFLMFDFILDTNHFLRLPNEQLRTFSDEVTILSQKMEAGYNNLLQNKSLDETVINEALNFLSKIGRTPFFIAEMKEKNNLGELTDIILKVNTSLQVANILKATNPNGQFSEDDVKLGIKTYLMQDMVL